MARTGITFDDVQAQFDLLQTQNETATIKKIQKGVKDKGISGIGGGDATILKHLKKIRESDDNSKRTTIEFSAEFLSGFNKELTQQTASIRLDRSITYINFCCYIWCAL